MSHFKRTKGVRLGMKDRPWKQTYNKGKEVWSHAFEKTASTPTQNVKNIRGSQRQLCGCGSPIPSHPTPNPYPLFQFVQNPTCVLKALKHIDHNFNKYFTSIKSQVKSIWHFPSTPLHLLPKAPSLDQFASTIV